MADKTCACCMADRPGMHAKPTARLGKPTIKPRDEMRVADPDRIKVLPSSQRPHSWDETN